MFREATSMAVKRWPGHTEMEQASVTFAPDVSSKRQISTAPQDHGNSHVLSSRLDLPLSTSVTRFTRSSKISPNPRHGPAIPL